jgi:hypothetical protein
MTGAAEVIVGHEDRIGRCPAGHERIVKVTLYWNPWGKPDGYHAGEPCHCGLTLHAVSRAEMQRAEMQSRAVP